jgi:hypothetical protein
VALLSWVFLTTLLHPPPMPTPTGGSMRALHVIRAHAGFSSWPTLAAATGIVGMPGRRNCTPNWLTLSPWPSPWPAFRPAASKWNPIELRLFSEVSRNWAGEPLDSYQKILNYARTTKTQSGLTVTAYLDRRNYPCGLKPTPH